MPLPHREYISYSQDEIPDLRYRNEHMGPSGGQLRPSTVRKLRHRLIETIELPDDLTEILQHLNQQDADEQTYSNL